MTDRDRSPIDQQWIQQYCDQLLAVANRLPEGVTRDVVLRRVEYAMDLLEGWQKRHLPMDQR